MYLLKLALRGWRSDRGQTIGSVIALGVLMVSVFFFYRLQGSLKVEIAKLRAEQVITAYLSERVESGTEPEVVDAIRLAASSPSKARVEYTSPKKFIDKLRARGIDDDIGLAQSLAALDPTTQSLMPRYISIVGELNDDAIERVRNVPGIESAESSKGRNSEAAKALSSICSGVQALMAGVMIALIHVLMQIRRHARHLFADLSHILPHLGAGYVMAYSPRWIHHALIGAIAGLSSAVLVAVFSQTLTSGFGISHADPLIQSVGHALLFPRYDWSDWVMIAAIWCAIGTGACLLTSVARPQRSR